MKQAQTVAIVVILLVAGALFALSRTILNMSPSHLGITETLDCTSPQEAKVWPGSHYLLGFDFDKRVVWVRVVNDQGAPYTTTPLQITLPQGQSYALQSLPVKSQTLHVKVTDTEISWIEYTHDGHDIRTLDRQTSTLKTDVRWKDKYA
ncbi:MAG TPA: hypothetical protein VN821_10755, partial [Candidatus Udaeobacter sp.]|nr:hypothetical protein [Candidatus Udaeobacter sp.]